MAIFLYYLCCETVFVIPAKAEIHLLCSVPTFPAFAGTCFRGGNSMQIGLSQQVYYLCCGMTLEIISLFKKM